MADTSFISPSTRRLIDLLARWPRKQISAALFATPAREDMLSSGRLAASLAALPTRRSAHPGPTPGCRALGYFDSAFPDLLKNIPDPPLVLYYQGELDLLCQPAIAVVGARRCTSQGRLNAQQLAGGLANGGVHIVSGLALGIDGAAHRGALAAHGAGRAIAVLGSGLQRVYPQSHIALARDIVASGGLLLSEYPAAVGPRAYQFPERNRLISGASLATVVVEASERSGSLITARFAAEQGRDVMAMPGPVQSLVSAGCHRLIKDGAGLVTGVEDVLTNTGLEPAVRAERSGREADLPAAAATVLGALQGYAVSLDELLAETNLHAAELTTLLVELELAGFVQQVPLGYIRTS